MSTGLLFAGAGGTVTLPTMPLLDRADGGHLWVNPPYDVWERAMLSAADLTQWSFLIAATAQAMLQSLPQLAGGCINYWEAGNWALNDAAEPIGEKAVHDYRRVHMHLLGRSRTAQHPDWQWGESPRFPNYIDAKQWASAFAPLNADECQRIKTALVEILAQKYHVVV